MKNEIVFKAVLKEDSEQERTKAMILCAGYHLPVEIKEKNVFVRIPKGLIFVKDVLEYYFELVEVKE